MCDVLKDEIKDWQEKDDYISNLIDKLVDLNWYCTQKENKIEDLKKKLQREQTYKSNARQSLKQRTKEKKELLKIIRNSAT